VTEKRPRGGGSGEAEGRVEGGGKEREGRGRGWEGGNLRREGGVNKGG